MKYVFPVVVGRQYPPLVYQDGANLRWVVVGILRQGLQEIVTLSIRHDIPCSVNIGYAFHGFPIPLDVALYLQLNHE